MPAINQDFHWPVGRDEVYRILVDYPTRHPDYLLQTYQDLSHAQLLNDATQGNIRHILMEHHAAAEIPAAFQFIIKPEMLKWTAEGWWDSESYTFREVIHPHVFEGQFDIVSTWQVIEYEASKTVQKWRLNVECSIPVIGGMFAGYVMNRVNQAVININQRRIQQLQAEQQTG